MARTEEGGVSMVCEVRMKDGSTDKYCKACFVGVLGSKPGNLYIQTRLRGNCKEIFIPLECISAYNVREPS